MCFMDIIGYVQANKNKVVDRDEDVMTSFVCFSKIKHQRHTYVYEGYISLNTHFDMHFYFSHKRSYISIDIGSLIDYDDVRLHCFLMRYVESLFVKYGIDEFIANLHSEDGSLRR
jgi:hypothetical protein